MTENNRLLTEAECYQATICFAHRLGRKVSRGTHAGDESLCQAQDSKTLKELSVYLNTHVITKEDLIRALSRGEMPEEMIDSLVPLQERKR